MGERAGAELLPSHVSGILGPSPVDEILTLLRRADCKFYTTESSISLLGSTQLGRSVFLDSQRVYLPSSIVLNGVHPGREP